MQRLGFSYDWSREISTCDADYYRWNQWFFLKLRELGLVYRRRSAVNFCPGCNTVIANEQVKDGRCERSGDAVVLRRMPEWAFRITRYAERLLANLNGLTDWPQEVVKKQRNWIGRSEGTEIDFQVPAGGVAIRVFTTRADTIFGCTCLVVAPNHPLIETVAAPDRLPAVREFAADQARKAASRARDEEPPKEGIDTGGKAIHPLTGTELPIWAANFVVSDYGTGALMSVPAHDERDFEFATKFALPIATVIQPASGDPLPPLDKPFTDDGVDNSGPFNGSRRRWSQRIALAARAAAGRPAVTYRQRLGISRQRH
jgi:leucyl-tRNA synthetase